MTENAQQQGDPFAMPEQLQLQTDAVIRSGEPEADLPPTFTVVEEAAPPEQEASPVPETPPAVEEKSTPQIPPEFQQKLTAAQQEIENFNRWWQTEGAAYQQWRQQQAQQPEPEAAPDPTADDIVDPYAEIAALKRELQTIKQDYGKKLESIEGFKSRAERDYYERAVEKDWSQVHAEFPYMDKQVVFAQYAKAGGALTMMDVARAMAHYADATKTDPNKAPDTGVAPPAPIKQTPTRPKPPERGFRGYEFKPTGKPSDFDEIGEFGDKMLAQIQRGT